MQSVIINLAVAGNVLMSAGIALIDALAYLKKKLGSRGFSLIATSVSLIASSGWPRRV
jgi:hypothetical protein